ncbi:PEP-CTERM sorting domain-containing protein [Planctomycetales bacterium ZRK34]|nr:PEP-CTERM sorting domain-containing protein [Planctomycetales bacterium ZRK34]
MRIVTAMVFALAVAPAAKAVVMVGFKLGSVGTTPLFTYSNSGTVGDLTDDTLVAANTVDFSVSVNGGTETTFDDAEFNFSLSEAPTILASGSDVTLFLTGSFTVSDGVDDILTVSFSNAELHFNATQFGNDYMVNTNGTAGGSIFANNLLPTQDVVYTAGTNATFLGLLGGMDFGGAQELSFTVESLDEAVPFMDGGTDLIFNGDPEGVGENFVFSSSFSGQSELVPEPAALGMIGMGLLVIVRRRRSA